MAEASDVNVGDGCEEKGPEGSSSEPVPPGTIISRVKLLDTMVDTFLQKLVAAGSYQRFTDCYKRFYQLQPEMTQRIYDKFITQLQTSIQKQEAENQQLADAVLAGRRQVEELQLQVQAQQQAWQALHREQRELVAVLREPE
ncbi:polyamine-modulated factor 1 isoform 8 [Daubentonia madagascariensis]|uniref:Polyamine-modulated factor 1 isoform 8 n=1 Tax=Daubentonia madagascariensis TaxID=31869 RepID=A0ABD2DXF5_DAUMA